MPRSPAKPATARWPNTPTIPPPSSPNCPTSPTSAAAATKRTPPSPRPSRRWSPPSTPAARSATPAISPTIRTSKEHAHGNDPTRPASAFGGKLLVLASVGATLEQIIGAEPAPEAYKHGRPLVGHDHRHREVHRLRQLRARLLQRKRRARRLLPHLGRALPGRRRRHRASRTSIRPTAASTASRAQAPADRQELLRPQALQPLRRFALRPGLPGGRHLRQPRRRRAGRRELLPRLPLLRAGLPLRLPLPPSREPRPSTSAPSATTASPRASPRPAARPAPPARASWSTSRIPRIRSTSSCAHTRCRC